MKIKYEYVIYKGDKFLYIGSKKECAEYLNVKENTIYFYTTPTYSKRFMENYDSNKLIILKV